jgi:hypothetical protein
MIFCDIKPGSWLRTTGAEIVSDAGRDPEQRSDAEKKTREPNRAWQSHVSLPANCPAVAAGSPGQYARTALYGKAREALSAETSGNPNDAWAT